MSEFEKAVSRASALPMTSATPKPRAGEHTFTSVAISHAQELDALRAERDLLREREGEVGKLLKAFCECVETLAFRMEAPNAFTPQFVQLAQSFRAALAKHGRSP